MKRGMLLCVIAGAAMIVPGVTGAALAGGALAGGALAGGALAGGGCHSGVTENDATGENEATVRRVDACFTATVTSVDPGTSVTFANTDLGVTHNVGGNQWGHFEDMIEGDAFTVRFDDAGIYPFACNYHPGMTGAIVVGDGTGATNAKVVSVQPFEPDTEPTTRVVANDEGLPAGMLAAAGVIGVAMGAGVALALARFGRRSATA